MNTNDINIEALSSESLLSEKEKRIKNLAKTDEFWELTYDNVKNYCELDNKINGTHFYTVFKAIYIDDIKMPKWKLTNYCNLSKSTLFDYRKEIIKFFKIFLEEDYVILKLNKIDEVALTELSKNKK